jgi:uncharacterized protein YqeY
MDGISAPDRLRQRLKTSLRVALKARDATAVAALRSAIGTIDNAEAVDRSHASQPASGTIATASLGVGVGDVARRELSTQDVVQILRDEVTERTAAAAEYERLGRAGQASRLRAEAAALVPHLDDAFHER